MSGQNRKHFLNVAGEFLVAGELQRRDVMASVTYGNAKQADVVAISDLTSTAVVIEVKTTEKEEWVVGPSIPQPSEKLWIFVLLPPDKVAAPRYFICTAAELRQLLMPRYEAYRSRYLKKHGKAFDGGGVETLLLTEAAAFEGKWDKIVTRVNGSQPTGSAGESSAARFGRE